MITCKNVSYSYKGKKKPAVDQVSLTLQDKYFTALVGHNGAGKTTLMKLLFGALRPLEGEICVEGKAIRPNDLYAVRQKVFFVTQEAVWNLDGTIRFSADLLGRLYPGFVWDDFVKILKLLDYSTGSEDRLSLKYSVLSRGEKMKVAIAFGLACHPSYMILDEPFANLDPVVKTDVAALLHEGVVSQKMGVLVSTHLVDEITDMVDYVAVMEKGRLVSCGDREEILANGSLRDALANGADQ